MRVRSPASFPPTSAELDPALGSAGRALRVLKRRLAANLGPALVGFLLFGSRARGDWDRDSDVDVAIIVRGLDRRVKHRIIEMVADVELEHDTPLATFLISEERYRELLGRERRIALDIRDQGIPL